MNNYYYDVEVECCVHSEQRVGQLKLEQIAFSPPLNPCHVQHYKFYVFFCWGDFSVFLKGRSYFLF